MIGGIVLFLAGLGIASIPLVISLTAWRTTAFLLVGEVIMMMGLLVTAYRRAKLCEMGAEGISTPGDLGHAEVRVLARARPFRANHDDDWGACDYFVSGTGRGDLESMRNHGSKMRGHRTRRIFATAIPIPRGGESGALRGTGASRVHVVGLMGSGADG